MLMIRNLVVTLSLACLSAVATPGIHLALPAQAAGVAIAAPGTVDPGQTFTATVPGGEGQIEIWGPVDGAAAMALLGTVPLVGGAAAITAPGEPGTYELRHVGPTGAPLGRFTLDVAAVPVTLSIASAIGAGLDNPVNWRGPGSPGDMIQIYDPASRSVVAEAPAVGTPGTGNVTAIRAPERFGAYELRYWSGKRHVPLRSLPIVVEEGTAWLRSPVEVNAGDKFEVSWNGPAAPGHVYRIVDEAGGAVVAERPAWEGGRAVAAKLKAPKHAGRYRIQFVDGATGFVLADLPLEVDPK
jgi:hypothetical protein